MRQAVHTCEALQSASDARQKRAVRVIEAHMGETESGTEQEGNGRERVGLVVCLLAHMPGFD
jgi:hypothetical protein